MVNVQLLHVSLYCAHTKIVGSAGGSIGPFKLTGTAPPPHRKEPSVVIHNMSGCFENDLFMILQGGIDSGGLDAYAEGESVDGFSAIHV